jgi:hypothetical protein
VVEGELAVLDEQESAQAAEQARFVAQLEAIRVRMLDGDDALMRRRDEIGRLEQQGAIVRGIDELTEAEFDVTIAVNLKSAFLCTQAVLPGMRAKQWGRIVNISSGAARGAGAIGVHYNASKAGMEGLTRGYAARLVRKASPSTRWRRR